MFEEDKLISIGKASTLLGITKWTLRRYPKDVITPIITPKGHRKYKLSDIHRLQHVYTSDLIIDAVAVYVRVSSHDQKKHGDLDRQKARVLQYAVESKYTVVYILDEVGSGLNDNRTKLHKLFKLVTEKKINRVIVEHKDRLTRFNFKMYEVFFKSHGVEIEVIDTELNKTFEEELTSDIVSLMASFSARLYGKRSSKNREKNENKQK